MSDIIISPILYVMKESLKHWGGPLETVKADGCIRPRSSLPLCFTVTAAVDLTFIVLWGHSFCEWHRHNSNRSWLVLSSSINSTGHTWSCSTSACRKWDKQWGQKGLISQLWEWPVPEVGWYSPVNSTSTFYSLVFCDNLVCPLHIRLTRQFVLAIHKLHYQEPLCDACLPFSVDAWSPLEHPLQPLVSLLVDTMLKLLCWVREYGSSCI